MDPNSRFPGVWSWKAMASPYPLGEVKAPRFAVSLSSRDPERIPGFTLPVRARKLPANHLPAPPYAAETDRLASLTSQYLSSWFLRAPTDLVPLTLEQRHMILLQAQLHASRVVYKEMRSAGLPGDDNLAHVIRRMQRQIQWLMMGVSAEDIAHCSTAHPTGDLPEKAPPISRPPLEYMAAAND